MIAQGGTRHAVDRPLVALEPAAGDPAVLPDRLLGGSARPRRRAAGGAAGARRSGDRRARAGRRPARGERPRARGAGGDAAGWPRAGILVPLALALFGADYLAPRNLLAAMLPVSAVIAVLVGSPRTGRAGALVGALIVLASLAITIDVNLSPRLQRGNWRALAHAIGSGSSARAVTTVAAGRDAAAVLPARTAQPAAGYEGAGGRNRRDRLRAAAPRRHPPAGAGLRAVLPRGPRRADPAALRLARCRGSSARPTLRRHVITRAHPEVLVPGDARLSA